MNLNFHIFILLALISFSLVTKAQDKETPAINLEKALLDHDYENKYHREPAKYISQNGCLIGRPPHFKKDLLFGNRIKSSNFILAARNYEKEYTRAHFSQYYVDTQNLFLESETESLKSGVPSIEKRKKLRAWLNREFLCLEEIKLYSETTKELLLKSAEEGYEPAMTALSVVYENGIGVEPDLIEAYAWRGVSVALHRPFGQDKLDELARKLDPFELNKAEDLSFQY